MSALDERRDLTAAFVVAALGISSFRSKPLHDSGHAELSS
jgi:hypothetical protein